jgi:citrate lyase subunit beta/citryl-CoA lyase
MTALRSVLFLPASNPRAIEKARGLACDAVVLDLEDAVAPEQKDEARAAMVEAVRAGGFLAGAVAVRVNGLDTPWGEEDLSGAAEAGPDVVVAPKVASHADVLAYNRRLGRVGALWAMVETCAGVLCVRDIAAAAAETRLKALVLGQNDLSREMRIRRTADRAALHMAMASIVTAARAYGLAALDGVFNGLDDSDGLAAECAQGRDFGFDGKTLIHPSQLAAASAAFSPSEAELQQARAIVAAFEDPANAGKGAIRVEGFGMAERLHLDEARRLLASPGAQP